MAERRMFAKTIIDSDAFLDMPLSSQALYFHLSMRADDEGFVNNPKRIQRTIGASDDDFKVLVAKNFVIKFESGVIVIKHWKIHNYIRGDRITKSKYEDERSLLSVKDNGAYTLNDDLNEIPQNLSGADLRKKAYEESELPYSFDYKIRQAFLGKLCPICGAEMRDTNEDGIVCNMHRPSIQHNIPLTKGGKHELGNISVICHKCNVSIQDNETDSLNADEVISVWDSLSHDSHMSVKCQSSDGTGKDSIGKDSIVEESIDNSAEPQAATAQDDPVVITFILNDKSEYEVTQSYIDEMQKCYPYLDILQELRKIKAWSINNPSKRKTRKGATKFIGNWFDRAQNNNKWYGGKDSQTRVEDLV
jgi:hypothetical protein